MIRFPPAPANSGAGQMKMRQHRENNSQPRFSRSRAAVLVLSLIGGMVLVFGAHQFRRIDAIGIRKTTTTDRRGSNTTTTNNNDYPAPYPHEDTVLDIQPIYGSHRPEHNAIFSFARGYKLQDYLLFVSTLYAQDYKGDLVLGVSTNLSPAIRDYFHHLVQQHPGVVIYEIPLNCSQTKRFYETYCQTVGMFRLNNSTTENAQEQTLPDTRPYRQVAQLRFEYFWAWTTIYDSQQSNIWLLDSRDLFFQRHPIQNGLLQLGKSQNTTSLHVFEESPVLSLGNQFYNQRWIETAYGSEILEQLKDEPISCSGSTFGGKRAIERYTRAMVHQYDVTKCLLYGCDQGHHNYLIRRNMLVGGETMGTGPGISHVQIYAQGEGPVNTLGILVENRGNLTDLGILNDKMEVLNTDRSTVSPIVHQYDRDINFLAIIGDRKAQLLQLELNRQAMAARSR